MTIGIILFIILVIDLLAIIGCFVSVGKVSVLHVAIFPVMCLMFSPFMS